MTHHFVYLTYDRCCQKMNHFRFNGYTALLLKYYHHNTGLFYYTTHNICWVFQRTYIVFISCSIKCIMLKILSLFHRKWFVQSTHFFLVTVSCHDKIYDSYTNFVALHNFQYDTCLRVMCVGVSVHGCQHYQLIYVHSRQLRPSCTFLLLGQKRVVVGRCRPIPAQALALSWSTRWTSCKILGEQSSQCRSNLQFRQPIALPSPLGWPVDPGYLSVLRPGPRSSSHSSHYCPRWLKQLVYLG